MPTMTDDGTRMEDVIRFVLWPGPPDTRRVTVFILPDVGEDLSMALERAIIKSGRACDPPIWYARWKSGERADPTTPAVDCAGRTVCVFHHYREHEAASYFNPLRDGAA